jgi:uncharacterized flavoprotein (TIGR03862 family)
MPAKPKTKARAVSVIGAGPAGLMAAEVLGAAGVAVTIHERMPSAGRKLLMAGRGGLNLTHSESLDDFLARYCEASGWMSGPVRGFTPADLTAWTDGLGQETFTGSSGRIFPRAMKASPLLRAWLARLANQGVTLKIRSEWRGWSEDGALVFSEGGSGSTASPDATVLALGGASWPRLGSDGSWVGVLRDKGAVLAPFQPANAGFNANWTPAFAKFAGKPLKAIAIRHQDRTVRGEAMIAAYGMEGGAIYALSPQLRAAIARDGQTMIHIDLHPEQTVSKLTSRMVAPRGSQTLSNYLRKAAGLSPQALSLLREATGGVLPQQPTTLAGLMKAVPITLTGTQGLDRAISTAGGLALSELDDNLMIRRLPGVFAAGEMLDWEAPTGGYLLQGSMATGVAAARGVLSWLGEDEPSGR